MGHRGSLTESNAGCSGDFTLREGNMKIRFSVLLALLFVMITSGCSTKEIRITQIPADNVHVGYAVSSYLLISEDEDTIKELREMVIPLIFQKSEEKIDFLSAYAIVFKNGDEVTARIRVDKYGVFELNDEEGTYKANNGSVDYNRIREIFEKKQ